MLYLVLVPRGHGETWTQPVTVNNGRQVNSRTMINCVCHGKEPLFVIYGQAGKKGWEKKHGNCDKTDSASSVSAEEFYLTRITVGQAA